jgi:hypothetical protein
MDSSVRREAAKERSETFVDVIRGQKSPPVRAAGSKREREDVAASIAA